MRYYSYNYFLPDDLLQEITEAVVEFAEAHDLQYDLWHHDLPVWVVRRQSGDRVDRVQIESVVTSRGSVLSFTPDAYADKSWESNGVVSLTRWLAAPDDVIKLRSQIHTSQLITPESLRFQEQKSTILHYLSDTWEKAQQLQLRDINQRV